MRTAPFRVGDGVWVCEPAHLPSAKYLAHSIMTLQRNIQYLDPALTDVVIEYNKALRFLNKALELIANFHSVSPKETP